MCSLHGHLDILPRGKLLRKYTAFQERHWELFIVVTQSLSHVQLSAVPWTAVRQASMSITITIFRSLLKLMSIGLVKTFNYLILCCPLLLLPSIFPNISVSFPLSPIFESGGQSTGVSASASVLPMDIQGWLPLELTGLIS